MDGNGRKIRQLNTYESSATINNPCLQYASPNTLRMLKLIAESGTTTGAQAIFTCITEDI